MKKQLLVGAFMLASFLTLQAQEYTTNFNDFTVGNIGTTVDGETEGQGGWFTAANNGTPASSNITNSNFQIFDHPTQGKVFQLTGPDGANGGAFMFKDAQDSFDLWNARTEGNNIYQVEYLYYTGGASTSKNAMGIATSANDATYKIACGITVDSEHNVYGRTYLTTGVPSAGNYLITFGEVDGETITLPADTWLRMGTSFNMTTGEVLFRVKDLTGTVLVDSGVDGPLTGIAPVEADFIAQNVAAGNAVAATNYFDNLKISFSATDTLLAGAAGTDENLVSSLSVFPNPANDVVNVVNAENILISAINVTDLNGRTVKAVKFDGVANAQVNVSDLASGVYMMTVSSDKGSMTKKIVKN